MKTIAHDLKFKNMNNPPNKSILGYCSCKEWEMLVPLTKLTPDEAKSYITTEFNRFHYKVKQKLEI